MVFRFCVIFQERLPFGGQGIKLVESIPDSLLVDERSNSTLPRYLVPQQNVELREQALQ